MLNMSSASTAKDGAAPAAATPAADGLEPAVRDLIAVFDQELAEVSFPDVSRDSLHAHAGAVHEQMRAVEELRVRLEAAQSELAGRRDALRSHADRALAYARVYAQGHPELGERLAAIAPDPSGSGRGATRRRGGRAGRRRRDATGALFARPDDTGTAAAAEKPAQ
jgi:hypothetical protein